MKKLIFIISLAFVFLIGNAQSFNLNLNSGKTASTYTGLASHDGDTIHGTSTLTKYINVKVDYLYYYQIDITLDSIVDGGTVTTALYGAQTIDGEYVQLGSTNTWDISATQEVVQFNNRTYTWTEDFAADSVTTVTIVEHGCMWESLKVLITGVGATTEISLAAIRAKIVKIP